MYTNMYGCANYGHFVMCEDIGMGNCAARMADPNDLFVFHENVLLAAREVSDKFTVNTGSSVEMEWFGVALFCSSLSSEHWC